MTYRFERRLAQRPTDEIAVLRDLEGGDPDADFLVLSEETVPDSDRSRCGGSTST